MKGRIKIIAIFLIMFSIIAAILAVFNSNKSIAYSVGQTTYFGALKDNNNLYCIDHMLAFRSGYHYCYNVTQGDRRIAYLVATRGDKGPGTAEDDAISNAIWEIIDGSANFDVSGILAEAAVAAQIQASGNIAWLKTPDNPVIENGSGYFGPFAITYPQDSAGNLGGGKVTILVNGKEVKKDTLGQKEFYLTIADGIEYGKENTVQVLYEATYYTSTESYFKPYAQLQKTLKCPKCGATNTATLANGTWIGSTLQKYNCDWTWSNSVSHNQILVNEYEERVQVGEQYKRDENGNLVYNEDGTLAKEPIYQTNIVREYEDCENADIGWRASWGEDSSASWTQDEWDKFYSSGHHSGYYNWQNVMYIDTQESPVKDPIDYTFWAGKPDIEIDLDKVDTSGRPVGEVIFAVTADNGKVLTPSITTGSDGKASIKVKPNMGASSITVTLTEVSAPANYIKYASPIKLKYQWDAASKQWKLATIEKPTNEKVEGASAGAERTTSNCVDKFILKAENRPIIRVYLDKTDVNLDNLSADGKPLENISFILGVSGGKINTEHPESMNVSGNVLTTDASGKGVIIIEPNPDATQVFLMIEEQDDIFYKEQNPIIIPFNYEDREGQWTTPNVIINKDNLYSLEMEQESKCNITVKNIAIIQELKLVKLNSSVTGEKVPGVTFRITLQNARTLAGGQLISGTTDANGEIDLGRLEVINPSQPITITLEEVAVPNDGLNYQGLYTSKQVAIITFNHKQAGVATNNSLVDAQYNLSNNTVIAEITNKVTMDLDGMVWLDGQTGLKPVQAPNGSKDSSESGVEGVTVDLIENGGKLVNTVVTNNSGNYEFKDLPASVFGKIQYHIEFTYDGINYIATPAGGDSDATEVNRQEFNDKFTTITKDTATGTNGSTTSLEYTYSGDDAILQTMSGNTVKEKYAMLATTKPTVYIKNTSGIDLGLVKKGVDLAAVTDIYEAKVSINAEERIYDYNDIQELQRDNNNNPILDNLEKNVRYNLYLYNSDYNYRIGDYKLSGVRDNTLTVNQNNASSNLYAQRVNDGVLNVEVTYQILLNNQSATDATINQIAYYYDTKYILTDILTDGITTAGNPVLATVNGTTYNKVILNVNQKFTDSDNQGIIELLFTIAKDTSGNVYTGIMQNLVEITSYSTNTSCIDEDSAPDNITVHSNEDDTDDAAGLNVQLNNIERAVSGYVFEDTKSNNPGQYNTGNGKYDNNEDTIDDVIVQLIEIKNVTVGNTTLKLEYIWQETVSGSNKVTYVTSDGKAKAEYTVANEPGHYTFNKNIIPGDYIVRFIYGDGTYYDTDSAANLLKYNGQDYKSTTDIYYNKPYYDTSYPSNNSMARDNEARRLEVMAYATSITANDASKLQIDTQEELNNTWMCAETSLILMKVSDAEVEGDSVNSIVRGVNFGLVERPRAYLVLEKHITGLKITGIVEGNATLENYDNASGRVELSYNSGEGILATATSKENNTIGDWIVETETDAIGGKKLDITYSYRITNIGDSDYIGEKLSQELSAGKTYSQIASEAKTLSSSPNYTPGAYLGTAYYNGNKTTDVVASIPFQVEDYMGVNEGLELDTTGDFKEANTNVTKNVWTYQDTTSTEKTPIIATEQVNVIQTKNILKLYTNQQTYFNYPLKLTVYDESLDSTSTRKDFTYRSYAAQLIYPTSGTITSETGSLCDGDIILGNLNTVKTHVEESSVPVSTVVPEADESIAETVVITMDTGDDKIAPVMLIISMTAGLAVVAVGIVLVKKFVIK